MSPFRLLEVEACSEVTVARFKCDAIGGDRAHAIGAELSWLAQRTSTKQLHLDLGEVSYLSAEALGELVTLRSRLQASGRMLVLVNVQTRVFELLLVTSLTRVFEIQRAATGNVMIVEDDALTREAFTVLLQAHGYAVHEAADGQEALEKLRQGPVPDCIVLDLAMPRLDGRQFRVLQREDPDLSAIPVVLVSGEANAAAEATQLGASAFLQKPVEPAALFEAVRQQC